MEVLIKYMKNIMNKGFIMIDSITALTLISVGMIFFCESNQHMYDNLDKARRTLIQKRIDYEKRKGLYDY